MMLDVMEKELFDTAVSMSFTTITGVNALQKPLFENRLRLSFYEFLQSPRRAAGSCGTVYLDQGAAAGQRTAYRLVPDRAAA